MKVTRAAVEQIKQEATAACTNEQITRQRVEAVEQVLRRPFFGRLKWLFLGR